MATLPTFLPKSLKRIVLPLMILDGHLLFHYLDDFLILGPDPVRLRAITPRLVRASDETGFLASSKSTLEPVIEIFFLG